MGNTGAGAIAHRQSRSGRCTPPVGAVAHAQRRSDGAGAPHATGGDAMRRRALDPARTFNKRYRERRLAARGAGMAFPSYTEAFRQLEEAKRSQCSAVGVCAAVC
jgi:hypothetical protein